MKLAWRALKKPAVAAHGCDDGVTAVQPRKARLGKINTTLSGGLVGKEWQGPC